MLFATWLSQVSSMISPQHLILILGRGTGKTTDIIAKRSMDICYDMPGCYVAISSDTYMNALKNVLPSIVEGWQRNGWIEGVHFVVGQRPPKEFYPKGYSAPYKPPIIWKHTITVFTGTHFKLISQDRPSTGAGDSYQHIVADEMKYQSEEKFNKLSPALRGEFVRFGHSHLYGGTTMTTDYPNTNHGEHDWFLSRKRDMDPKNISLILYAAAEVNKLNIDIANATEKNDLQAIATAERSLARWTKRLQKTRKDSTFFYQASSFVNIGMLRIDFFKNALKTMNFREVMTSVFSIPPTLEKGQMFYPNLSSENFYGDSYIYSRFDKSDSGRDVDLTSIDLKYINNDIPLEGGLDTGKMCSLVVGQQESDKIYRVLKEFYTIPPEFLPELGEKFRAFFKYHANKKFLLYHDRAANKMQSVGEDHAGKMKKAIEYDKEGLSTGWVVELKNRNQANILQETEYELLLEMLNPRSKVLPFLKIDKHNCPCLKSSMQKAEIYERITKNGQKTKHKDKSSEKLPDEMLPMNSTNMSDAAKYLLCRPEFLSKISGEETNYHFLG